MFCGACGANFLRIGKVWAGALACIHFFSAATSDDGAYWRFSTTRDTDPILVMSPPPLSPKWVHTRGGDMTRLGANFRTSKLPTFLGAYPRKKCFFGEIGFQTFRWPGQTTFFRRFEVPFRTHPKRCRFSAAEKKGGGHDSGGGGYDKNRTCKWMRSLQAVLLGQ